MIKITLLFLLLAIIPVVAQSFGKNKVQYQPFKWHYLQSEHFDVYFYPGSYDLAVFTANEAESSYVYLRRDFNYQITDRVRIILYKSHNDFQQTNVVDTYLPEGVGGVTELFKNRVVIPFEGSYSQLRHVLHHELVHAVMNDMLYGGSIQSIISGQVVPVPLWFSEGLAEYFSVRWDTRADMIIRDATISGYLPPINYLSYYLAYQGGQSLFRYIAQKYGHKKVSEILHKIKGSFRFDAAVKSAVGISIEELSENWQKEMRKEYWPDIADRKETKEVARALTDHKKDKNYLNSGPALSPKGDKIIFLSDREGKQSIYLMDILENKIIKKLIKGESSTDFEELNWLSPGMDWSPDGKFAVFSAKAGDQDALYIYDFASEEVEQHKFNLDGIYSAAWSPGGEEIAFVGNLNGASDIYIYHVESKELVNITNDVFSDSKPSWSVDGQKITFVSDRGDYVSRDSVPLDFQMSLHDYDNEDIYIMDHNGANMVRITDSPFRETDPVFAPDGTTLFYTSDKNGISNIYRHNIETHEAYPITNLLTGAFQLDLDKEGKTLVFTSFFEGGWDIFTLKDPLELETVELQNTQFFKKLYEDKLIEGLDFQPVVALDDTVKEKVTVPGSSDYSRYVFADLPRRTETKKVNVELKEDEYKLDDGHYKVRNYKVKFSPDLVNGAAYYNTLWGFQGYTSIAFSDVLGNHKMFLGTNLVFDLRNSYLTFQYWYLPKRIDYGLTAFHYADTYLSAYSGLLRFRNYGLWAIASRPFNKFTRVDVSLNWWNVTLEYFQIPVPTQTVRSIIPGIQLVHDTSEWSYSDTGPRDGFRGSIGLNFSPKYSSDSPEFVTFKSDLRRYFKLSDNYSIGLRFSGGASRGKNPQLFFLGGVSNWLNRKFNGGIRINSIYDVYFSEFITPLRGARYYEKTGNNYGLVNVEFRFPLIPYMQLGFPPMALGNIKGVFFTDVGTAWDSREPASSQFRGVKDGRLHDIVAGYGIGTRVYLGFLGMILKYDVAWQFDLAASSVPKHYLSIGIDF